MLKFRTMKAHRVALLILSAACVGQFHCTEENTNGGDASVAPDASQLDLASDAVLSDAGDMMADQADGLTGDGAADGLTGDGAADGLAGDGAADGLAGDKSSPDSGTGKWYQANKAYCPSFCKAKGKKSVAGPEGATCMSGEARSASGVKQGIKFPYGCWGGCGPMSTPHTTVNTTSGYCFRKGYPQDYDSSDRTVGCFCR